LTIIGAENSRSSGAKQISYLWALTCLDGAALRSWAKKLMQTKPFKLVAVALANKMARIAFAIIRRHRQRPRTTQESMVTKR
jgi:hypothetical protein